MKASDIDLNSMLSFEPQEGRIIFGGERLLLFRQEALAILRRLLNEQLGQDLCTSILFQFGFACGKGDYENLSSQFEWDHPNEVLAAGPILHSWEGICRSDSQKMEFDKSTKTIHHIGHWYHSYEAEAYKNEFGPSQHPVCWSLTGYASGYISAFLDTEVLAIERKCVGMGDDICVVEAKALREWGDEADAWKKALHSTQVSLTRELESKIALVEQQALAISELSTPVMEVWDDVLVLPIVGVVDTRRSVDIMNNLLAKIVEGQSKCVILDITGVEIVDTKTADYLLKVVRAATLLGSRCVLTGLSPAVAQTLVEIGADMQEVRTLRNLKEGLKDCLRYLSSQTDKVTPTVR